MVFVVSAATSAPIPASPISLPARLSELTKHGGGGRGDDEEDKEEQDGVNEDTEASKENEDRAEEDACTKGERTEGDATVEDADDEANEEPNENPVGDENPNRD